MAIFLGSQLDFIFFFYGLAFILLGMICLAARGGAKDDPWAACGLFGLAHGAGEWLDLTALVIGDSPTFQTGRIALMALSFMFLLEGVRLGRKHIGTAMPGRWIYAPLTLLIVSVGALAGNAAAGATARYTIGFLGSAGASLNFVYLARKSSGTTRRFAVLGAVGFAIYAIAAGAIAPAAPFWPADFYDQAWFFRITGVPIQLVRGSLACAITLSVWVLWRERVLSEVGSAYYAAYVNRSLRSTVGAMAAILMGGFVFTNLLGDNHQQRIVSQAQGDMDLLASRLSVETASLDAMAKLVAQAPATASFLTSKAGAFGDQARAALNAHAEAAGAEGGFILDRSGTVAASSRASAGAEDSPPSANFGLPIASAAGHDFEFDAATGKTIYYASYPVIAADRGIVGVVALAKPLDAFADVLNRFERKYFFVSPDGIATLTNVPEAKLRALWDVAPARKAALNREFGNFDGEPIFNQVVHDGVTTNFGGDPSYLARRYVPGGRWSLIVATSTTELFATRVLGIIVTLLTAVTTLIYLFSRDRQMRNVVEMERRLKLQELAQNMRAKATTDALTGLNNRLKFDETFAVEIARTRADGTPLSLVLFDLDHFKRINDTYGHQAGDKTLVKLSLLASAATRASDVLARWGGDEFVMLLPDTDGHTAREVAERLGTAVRDAAFEHGDVATCTFGVAQYVHGETIEAFIARADAALYRAKSNGRDRVGMAAHDDEIKSLLA